MLKQATAADAAVDARLREVLSAHLDPKWGSPYWLERARRQGFDPRNEIRATGDLPRLDAMEPAELAGRALDDFIPRSVLDSRPELIVAQTGGTSGRPVWTAYSPDEFDDAFVEPFIAAADHVGFPLGGTWLYVGPSGPHIIGRAAEAIARRSGSASPFMVDFDPRWARKLVPDSFAARRYLGHVVEQALAVIRTQPVDVLFTTPRVLRALAGETTPAERDRVRGIHYGGMALDSDELRQFQEIDFTNAVHLSGYGNTLFGCCLELDTTPGRTLRYYPYGDRIVFRVTADGRASDDSAATMGRVVFSRLDRTVLLINVVERDIAWLVAPPTGAPVGFHLPGVESPAPAAEANTQVVAGLY